MSDEHVTQSNWPFDSSEMSSRIRAYDWGATPLGQIEHWPQSLKTVLDLILAMRRPATLLWGPFDIQLYNDAYISIAQDRHPVLLGRPVAEGWPDTYESVIRPVLEAARSGRSTRLVQQLVPLRNSDGLIQERYFDTDVSPVRDETGAVAGSLLTSVEITERHRAESAMRESKAQLALFVEHAPAAIAMFDREMRYLAHSRRFVTDTRLTNLDSIIGRSHYEIFPEIPQRWRDVHARVLAGETLSEDEDPFPRLDGRTDWVRWTMTPWRTAEGAIGGVLLFSEIRTEQVEARRALAVSEERLRMAQSAAGVGIWDWDLRSNRTSFNDEYYAMYGLPAGSEHTYQDFLALVHPDDRDRVERAMQTTLASAGYYDCEYRVLRPSDTTERWMAARGRAEFVEGCAVRVLGTVQDITERKRAEAALRASEEEYRSLFDTIDEGFAIMEAVFDPQGKVEDLVFRQINRVYPQVVGFTPVIGRRAKEYVPNLDARWLDKYARVIATGEPCREEGYVQDIDSWLSVHLSLVGQRGSHLVAAVFNNITERKRAEIALRESEERQAFMLQLSDLVRPLADPADIQGETTRLLREQLSAAWCFYVDWDLDKKVGVVLRDSVSEGLPSLAGAHDVSDAPEFLQLLAAGAVLTVRDYASYEQLSTRIRQKYVALGFRSMMAAPLVKEGRLIASLLVGDTKVRDWSASEASILVEVGERTWAAIERGRAEAALRETEELRRVALDSGGMGAWTWDTRAGTVSADEVVQRLWGVSTEEQPQAVSLYADLMYPEAAAWLAAVAAKEIAPGEEFHTQVQVASGRTSSRWVEIRGRAERATPWIINGVSFDITEQREWAERQDVLVAELQHRTRNLIAVVSSIAQQTMARTGPTEAFQEEFYHRLQALARVQGLLSRSDEEPITIETLVRMELDALGAQAEPGRIEIKGPPARIRNSAVQILALALHELATNARKYGALSLDQGRLQVQWRTYRETEGERLALEWVELGGLPPEPDGQERSGYGRELIERALPYSLNAKTSFQHDDAGLRCVIDMPMMRTKSRWIAT